MTSIGERIKEFAISKYGSVAGLAKATDRKPQYWDHYIANRNRPGTKSQSLLRSVGADVDFIMTGRKPAKEEKVGIFFSGEPSDRFANMLRYFAELSEDNQELAVKIIQQLRDAQKNATSRRLR